MKKAPSLHPWLLILYPILFLYAHNIDELLPQTLLMPCIIALSIGFFFYAILWSVTKSHIKAGLATSAFAIIFYWFGNFQDVFARFIIHNNVLCLIFILMLFVLLCWKMSLHIVKHEVTQESVKKLLVYICVLIGFFLFNIIASYVLEKGYIVKGIIFLGVNICLIAAAVLLIIKLKPALITLFHRFRTFFVLCFLCLVFYIIIYQSGIKGVSHSKLLLLFVPFLLFIFGLTYYLKEGVLKKALFVTLVIIFSVVLFIFAYLFRLTLFYNLIPELFAAMFLTWLVLSIIFSGHTFLKINTILNVASGALLLIPLYNIVTFEMTYWKSPLKVKIEEISIAKPVKTCRIPVYYIILDEYASSETIHELFGYNNSSFTDRLRKLGFYTGDWTTTSDQTVEVVANVLNLGHHPHGLSGRDNFRGLQNNFVSYYFKKAGYKIFQYPVARYEEYMILNDADSIMKLPEKGIRARMNDFNRKIWYYALTRRYIKHDIKNYREQINYVFDNTYKLAQTCNDTPFFVYAHIVSPHAPYIFDSCGNEIGFQSDGLKFYLGQYQYINDKTADLAEKLIKTHAGRCAVIIQSDHGPRLSESGIPTTDEQKLKIFSAIYLPDKNYEIFADSFCININTFAFVFNKLFEETFPLKTKNEVTQKPR